MALLGPLEIHTPSGSRADLGGPQQRLVLTLLALATPNIVTIETLVDALWPDRMPRQARKTVQTYISALRRVVDGTELVVETQQGGYRLRPHNRDQPVTDVGLLEQLLHQAAQHHRDSADRLGAYRDALALWRGEPFADLAGNLVLEPSIALLSKMRETALHDLTELELRTGARPLGEVVAHLEALVTQFWWHEQLWALLMEGLYRQGRQAESLVAFQRARRILRDERGLEPGPHLREMEQRVLRQDATLLGPVAPDPPRPNGSETVAHNLPGRLSSFIGRRTELAELHKLVRDHRCVTITGTGGVGKTRVALQFAAQQPPDMIDGFEGIWWLELSPLAEASAVAITLATAVGANLDESLDTFDAIVTRLRTGRALLVFDNCEHLVEECARIAETVLLQCPNVRILATSRVPLGIPGEMTWRIPSLVTPHDDTMNSAEIEHVDAVKLFVERARQVSATFELTDANTPTIVAICRKVDGIPLAIELAASRVRSLSPRQILDGLADALRMLSGGPRLVTPRHQTLDASVRWSYDLLAEPSRRLFDRVSVFRGTFDLRSAESICSGDGLAATDVLDALEQLIDHSLVVASDRGRETRFHLLETVRQFGDRSLELNGSREHWARNHACHFAQRAADISPRCETAHQFEAVAELEADRDNLHAALVWHRDLAEPDAFAALVCDLAPFWDVGGDRLDGTRWATRALDALPASASVLRARLTAFRGEWRLTMGSFREALEDCNTAMSMGAAVGDAKAEGRGSSTLTTVLAYAALDRWKPQWEKTVELLTAAGDTYALAGTLTWGAVPLLRRGFTNEGLAALDRARPYVLATGQPLLNASQLLWEGFAANQAGDPARAEELATAALSSDALRAQPRVEGAEIVRSIARGLQGLSRRSWREHQERTERARREGEALTVDQVSVMTAQAMLREQPAEARSIIDRWLAERNDAVAMVVCEGTMIGAQAAFRLGDLDDAWSRAQHLRHQALACQHVLLEARAGVLLGAILLIRDEPSRADVMVRSAITLHVEHGNRTWLCESMEVLAAIVIACGDVVGGAQLFGAVGAARAAMNVRTRGPFRQLVGRAVAAAREALDGEGFDRELRLGSAWSLDDTVAFVATRLHPFQGP